MPNQYAAAVGVSAGRWLKKCPETDSLSGFGAFLLQRIRLSLFPDMTGDYHTSKGADAALAARLLQQGHCVAIPTETVYGLAANALDNDAVLKIFTTKNRPHFDPLIVHVANMTAAAPFVQEIPAVIQALAEAFTPGPVTFLLPRTALIPDLVTSGLDTVGIRVPNHPLTLSLLEQLEFPLAAPSANPFGYISPTTADHVLDQLAGLIPYVLDGGRTTVGVESTIVGFAGDQLTVFRKGGLAVEAIEALVGKVMLAADSGSNPRAPGMLQSHYAPRKKLYFNPARPVTEPGVWVIAFDRLLPEYPAAQQVLLSPESRLEDAARHLFSVMRQLDAGIATAIVTVAFPDTGLGRAINDRLRRASAD